MPARTRDAQRPPVARLVGGALLTAALLAGPGAAAAFADGRPEPAPAAQGAGQAHGRPQDQDPAHGRPQDPDQAQDQAHDQDQDQATDPAGAQSLAHRTGFVGTVVDPNPGAQTFGLRVTAGGAPTTLTVALDAGTAFPGAADEDAAPGAFFARLADLGPDARATVVARERTDGGRLAADLVVLRAAGAPTDEG